MRPRPASVYLAGSSPLTRGKPTCTMRRARCIGLIPAHAGKTRGWRRWPFRAPAHPRSRGENRFPTRRGGVGWGSSPLTRGKHRGLSRLRRARGLIPAHAGKTGEKWDTATPTEAHPRSRGENALHPDEVMNALGSSPLTRGKPSLRRACRAATGLIPAHAGKTRHVAFVVPNHWAHPRSRGDNVHAG